MRVPSYDLVTALGAATSLLADGGEQAPSGAASMGIILAAIVALVLVIRLLSRRRPHRPRYRYRARRSVMTRREEWFFRVLQDALGRDYLIFPQIHISSLLDERIKGQNWAAARGQTNSKSVDYVVADARTLDVLCAVELDDATHDREDRRERDRQVEEMFAGAGMPLVRFRDAEELTAGDVRRRILRAIR